MLFTLCIQTSKKFYAHLKLTKDVAIANLLVTSFCSSILKLIVDLFVVTVALTAFRKLIEGYLLQFGCSLPLSIIMR